MLDFLSPFIAIALAELGDKSQLSIFLLSSRTKRRFSLLLGVMCGFGVVDGLAIFVGSWIVKLVPTQWISVASGTLFIVLGILLLLAKDEEDGESTVQAVKNPFVLGFTAIGLAEWGDKTQFASALFAAEYNPFIVFAAVMSALLLLSLLALLMGHILTRAVKPAVTKKIAGVVFVGLGIVSMLQ